MKRERKLPFDPKVFLSKVNGGRAISDYRNRASVYRVVGFLNGEQGGGRQGAYRPKSLRRDLSLSENQTRQYS